MTGTQNLISAPAAAPDAVPVRCRCLLSPTLHAVPGPAHAAAERSTSVAADGSHGPGSIPQYQA